MKQLLTRASKNIQNLFGGTRYICSIAAVCTVVEILSLQLGRDLDLSRSHDVISYVNIRLVYTVFYICSIDTDPLSWPVFEILSLINNIRMATLTLTLRTCILHFIIIHSLSVAVLLKTILKINIFDEVTKLWYLVAYFLTQLVGPHTRLIIHYVDDKCGNNTKYNKMKCREDFTTV